MEYTMGSKLILLLWLIVGSLLIFFCLNKEKRDLLLKYKNIYLNQAKVSDVANVKDMVKEENPKGNRAVFTVIKQEEFPIADELMDKNSTIKSISKSISKNISNVTEIKIVEDKITLLLQKNPIYFKTNSSTIREDSQEGLMRVLTTLKALPKGTVVTVKGHTDATGDAISNKKLSQQRADAVKFYLKKGGLNYLVIEATGYGADQPLVSDPNDKKNRRVEIRLERGE